LGINLQRVKNKRGVDLTVWPPRYDSTYRPRPGEEFWLPEIECADETDRNEIVFSNLAQQVRYAWERSPFYRGKWEEAGVSPETLKSLADLERFPVLQKADLRKAQEKNPPFGDQLCIKPEDIARIHGTSGTTGRPFVFGIGADDWKRIGNAHARIMWAAGIRPEDRIIVCSWFSLYVGSWGALIGGSVWALRCFHLVRASRARRFERWNGRGQ
jgi:phenylacetate-CoA ligase